MKKQFDLDDETLEQAICDFFCSLPTSCKESIHDITSEIETLPTPSWEEIERMADEIMKQEENPS